MTLYAYEIRFLDGTTVIAAGATLDDIVKFAHDEFNGRVIGGTTRLGPFIGTVPSSKPAPVEIKDPPKPTGPVLRRIN
jgi:hypothetical protein